MKVVDLRKSDDLADLRPRFAAPGGVHPALRETAPAGQKNAVGGLAAGGVVAQDPPRHAVSIDVDFFAVRLLVFVHDAYARDDGAAPGQVIGELGEIEQHELSGLDEQEKIGAALE